MLPAPRIIAIDDDPKHLRGIADGLNEYGVACLQVHFTGDDSDLKQLPHVRVIFADLHLSDGGAGHDHERDFAVIGGLIEQKIAPSGPYVIVLWTRFADQAAALKRFLDERLRGVPKPFAVTALDKNVHLGVEGKVVDVQKLVAAIVEIVKGEPQVAALLNWEERVLGAAADTVSAVLELAPTATGQESASQRLRRILYHLAAASVGKQHVFADRFQAVNEALLPILADRIAILKSRAGLDDIWNDAILEADAASELTAMEAATLNRSSHVADGPGTTGAARGAVVVLPPNLSAANFAGAFGMSPIDAAQQQFGCNEFVEGDARFRWVLVQVQAVCDFSQRQPGSLPFVLTLEMPITNMSKRPQPAAVWTSPPLAFGAEIRLLRANSRFQTTMPYAAASGLSALYRVRGELLDVLIYHIHGYGARPGNISFFEVRPKPTAGGSKAEADAG